VAKTGGIAAMAVSVALTSMPTRRPSAASRIASTSTCRGASQPRLNYPTTDPSDIEHFSRTPQRDDAAYVDRFGSNVAA
jgi:hypothetical protein